MADITYTGTAGDVSQIEDFTIGGTPAQGDVVTITARDGSTMDVTVGSTATTSQVATEIYNALTGTTLGSGYSLNTQTTPPAFAGSELDNTTTSVVRITGNAGQAGGVTMAFDGGSSGTVSKTTVQSATGDRFADNAENFSGGAVATTGDKLILSERDVDLSYNLTAIDDIDELEVRASWSGRLGLPEKNDESGEYYEPEDKYLVLAGSTNVTVGTGSGLQGAQMLRLDFDGNGGTIDIQGTGSRKEADVAPVDIINLTSGTVTIDSGEVWLTDCTTCTVTVTGSATVRLSGSITGLTVNGSAAVVSEGAVTTLTATDGTITCESTVGTANLSNCTATIEGAVTTANLASATVEVQAGITTANVTSGTVTVQGTGTIGTLTGLGGTIKPEGGITITTATLENKASLDLSSTVATVTITNPVDLRGASATIKDPARKISSLVVDLMGATAKQVDRGMWNRLTYGAPA